MIYRAYANRQEITEFSINGVNTDEIWGSDILLWRRENIPPTTAKYAIRFIFKKGIYVMDPIGGIVQPPTLTTDEAGYRLYISKDKPITPKKIAYCVKTYRPPEYPDTDVYAVAVGIISEDGPWVIPYDARKGEVNLTNYSLLSLTSSLSKISLSDVIILNFLLKISTDITFPSQPLIISFLPISGKPFLYSV